jgi:hypothetical protein
MLKWALHVLVAAIGITAFVHTDINSQSALKAGLYPFLMWVAIIYSIVVAVTMAFGWPGPRGGAGSAVDHGTLGASNDGGGSGDSD